VAGSAGGVVRMGLSHLGDAEVAAWVAASCAAQGVPVKVTDPTVVRRVGDLLGASGRGRAQARQRGTAPTGAPSESPGDAHAGRVQALASGGAGSDGGVVDDGGDDGVLSGEVEGVPRSA
jgi:hypothetical protein